MWPACKYPFHTENVIYILGQRRHICLACLSKKAKQNLHVLELFEQFTATPQNTNQQKRKSVFHWYQSRKRGVSLEQLDRAPPTLLKIPFSSPSLLLSLCFSPLAGSFSQVTHTYLARSRATYPSYIFANSQHQGKRVKNLFFPLTGFCFHKCHWMTRIGLVQDTCPLLRPVIVPKGYSLVIGPAPASFLSGDKRNARDARPNF